MNLNSCLTSRTQKKLFRHKKSGECSRGSKQVAKVLFGGKLGTKRSKSPLLENIKSLSVFWFLLQRPIMTATWNYWRRGFTGQSRSRSLQVILMLVSLSDLLGGTTAAATACTRWRVAAAVLRKRGRCSCRLPECVARRDKWKQVGGPATALPGTAGMTPTRLGCWDREWALWAHLWKEEEEKWGEECGLWQGEWPQRAEGRSMGGDSSRLRCSRCTK